MLRCGAPCRAAMGEGVQQSCGPGVCGEFRGAEGQGMPPLPGVPQVTAIHGGKGGVVDLSKWFGLVVLYSNARLLRSRLAEGSNASSLEPRHCVRISSRKKKHYFLRQLVLVLLAILKALAPFGAGVSVIAPLPERLPGLIEGSLRSQSPFEYMCLVVILL